MFDTALIALDMIFPYIRFPFFLMIAIILILIIYLLLNVKTTFHRSHYIVIFGVVLLCAFQTIPVSESRKNEQLKKAEKLLHIVENDDGYTQDVQKLSAKLRNNIDNMLKKGYLNFSNIYTITILRHDLKVSIAQNQRINTMVGIHPKIIKPTVEPIKKINETEPKQKIIVLEEVSINQADDEHEIQSASETISVDQVQEVSTENADQSLIYNEEMDEYKD